MQTTSPITLTEAARLRFWKNVEPSDQGCWEWTATTNAAGYGTICGSVDGVRYHYLAHRVAWTIVFGEIPSDMLICHTCDNPSCCNPMHFFLGDHAANAADREAKGRTPWYIAQMAAKTHCPSGHEYAGANLGLTPKGHRYCLTCKAEKRREIGDRYKQRLVDAATSGQFLEPTDQDRATAAAYKEARALGVPYTQHLASVLDCKVSKVQHLILRARAAGLVPIGPRMKRSGLSQAS